MMLLQGFVFCVFFLLQSLVCAPIEEQNDEKVKPVFLVHNCMQIYTNGKLDKGTPILLLHGMTASRKMWGGVDQVLAVKTGRRVCVADLRNHGSSPWDNRTDIEAMAVDVNQLLDMLDMKKVILLGSSMGGKVAVHTALQHPEKVEKVIVEDMRANGIPPLVLKFAQAFLKLIVSALPSIPKGVDEATAKAVVLKYMNDRIALVFPSFKEYITMVPPMKCVNGTWDFEANVRLFVQVMDHPDEVWTESTGLFEGPALFLYGTKSPFKVGEDESNIRKLFPNVQMVPLEGVGHGIHAHPKYLDEVLKFIKSD